MIVAKNSLGIKENETNYEYETMKNVLTKSVFPSLYKLLQVAMSLPILHQLHVKEIFQQCVK